MADQEGSADKADDEVEERPELAISGAVLDDQGSLLPGVTVEARPVGPPGQSRRQYGPPGGALNQVTDNLGSFVFEPLADGEYQLSVDDTDDFHGTRMRVRAGIVNAELRVQTRRSIRVHGAITDGLGDALESVRVRALGEHQGSSSDAEGHYEITVEPTRTDQPPVLEFQLSGYRSQRQRVDIAHVSDSDQLVLDVAMESVAERGTVLGQVFGPRGEPVADAEVWLSSSDPRGYLSTRTNGGGEFRFERVETGDAWRLGVNPGSDYQKYVSRSFAISPHNTSHDVQLEASGTGTLIGRLIDPEGRVLGRFTMWLRSEDAGGGRPMSVASDARGNFEVEEVPAGRLRLETLSQPRLQAGGIELGPGETRQVEVPLDWGESWLFGQVVDAAGKPVAGARVTLQWQQQHYGLTSSSHRQAGTDLEGHFNFSNLGARDYSVTVQAPGYQTVRRSLSPGMDEARIVIEPLSMAGGGT
ncbi:MAG: carboxypeptidase regulatory-like domain-containing protein [Wenzhouxiangellaceae bacterium]